MQKLEYDQESYILVVDDDATLLKFFKIHLNKFFSKIIVVKSAKEAIETLREEKIDLVISDIRMPRFDGIQLMKKIRHHDPSIPVFLVSGALLDEKQRSAVETKSDGFLKKPFDIDDLHKYITEGMRYRRLYKQLYEIVTDKKKFQNLVRGKSFPKIADKELRLKAKELYRRLQVGEDIDPPATDEDSTEAS